MGGGDREEEEDERLAFCQEEGDHRHDAHGCCHEIVGCGEGGVLRRRLAPLWGPWPVIVNGTVGGRVATHPMDLSRSAPLSRPRSARCAGIPGSIMDYDGLKEMFDKQEKGFEGVALSTRLNNHNE